MLQVMLCMQVEKSTEESKGYYGFFTWVEEQIYADFIASFKKTIEDFSIFANLGTSIEDARSRRNGVGGTLDIPNAFYVHAIKNRDEARVVVTDSKWRQQTQSIFGSLDVGWKDMLYLTLTGRNDWSSTLSDSENFCVFNAPRNWLNSLFNDQMINVYSPWFKLKDILESEGKLEHYSWAWAELLRVAAVHRTTDMYGPIPYSAIKENTGSMYVAYDTQEEVYKGLFEDLNKAIEILTLYLNAGGANEASALKEYDMVYEGNFEKWVRFANSLKLRMAMRIAFVDEANAKKYALEALNHPIGVMTSNEDNAWIKPSVNPLYIMYGPYADTKACAEIMTYLTGYKDPRKEAYFSCG